MNRSDILSEADSLVNGQRAQDYGDAFDNHQRIADGWNIIIRAALLNCGEITPQHVALMMDWLKTSRLLNTMGHEDSWVDKAAYSSLGGEFATRGKDAKV